VRLVSPSQAYAAIFDKAAVPLSVRARANAVSTNNLAGLIIARVGHSAAFLTLGAVAIAGFPAGHAGNAS
jgi:hypothetical protein